MDNAKFQSGVCKPAYAWKGSDRGARFVLVRVSWFVLVRVALTVSWSVSLAQSTVINRRPRQQYVIMHYVDWLLE